MFLICVGPPSSPLPHVNTGRPALARTPSYKAEASPSVFIPKENELLSPSYEVPSYNLQSEQGFNAPPPPVRKYGNFNNYNTAPRGWGQQRSYKTVSFTDVDYSDF